ncbi:uncharacterized protein LOC9663357 [Selaginella moellendorffii]|uniref:uncharacterized protein LOC9663357 n=1 Tax=Selaginella moellendorffii TaxID=88036 RepID=UPI000D1C7438|nr:uncharacterized protein LOC9663357 [Selaginella moellendorffii]|eukprot:XP_024522914.1 uncharacterized protein LOC9663357 [Selaginella moellendorffii]
MGSYISIHNNTPDTYLVKVGHDEAALSIATIVTGLIGALAAIIVSAGALSGVSAALVANGVVSVFGISTGAIATITAAAASIKVISIGATVVDWAAATVLFITNQVQADGGYYEILPGQKRTYGRYSLSLWRQGTCYRIRVNPDNPEQVITDVVYMRPIFSGATNNSVLEHNIQHWIDRWGHEDQHVVTLQKENFSLSSRNISFVDGQLRAECRDSSWRWHNAVMDLNYYYENINGVVKTAKRKPGNFTRSCSEMELKGAKIFGLAETEDKRKVKFELDLDIDIANKDGRLICNDLAI